jgi:micrococcal nuclease
MRHLRATGAAVVLLTLALLCGSCDSSPVRDANVASSPSPGETATPTAAAGTTCAPPYPSGAPTIETVFCADPASMQPASVVRIIDGDTFVALVDGREETVRFFGTDTPERGDECFADATERLRVLAGAEVRLLPDLRDRDRNGRLLRYVFTPAGLSIDATLIGEGLARAWTRDGALRVPLIELEAQASAARSGCLWRDRP